MYVINTQTHVTAPWFSVRDGQGGVLGPSSQIKPSDLDNYTTNRQKDRRSD